MIMSGPKITVEMNGRRTLGTFGAVSNRLRFFSNPASVALAQACARKNIDVVVERAGLFEVLGDDRVPIYRSAGVGSMLSSAGVSSLSLKADSSPFDIQKTFKALATRSPFSAKESLSGVADVGIKVTDSVKMPFTWGEFYGASVGHSSYIKEDIAIIAGASILAGCYVANQNYFESNLVKAEATFLGAALGALFAFFSVAVLDGTKFQKRVWSDISIALPFLTDRTREIRREYKGLSKYSSCDPVLIDEIFDNIMQIPRTDMRDAYIGLLKGEVIKAQTQHYLRNWHFSSAEDQNIIFSDKEAPAYLIAEAISHKTPRSIPAETHLEHYCTFDYDAGDIPIEDRSARYSEEDIQNAADIIYGFDIKKITAILSRLKRINPELATGLRSLMAWE
jgi:hypothetical protein